MTGHSNSTVGTSYSVLTLYLKQEDKRGLSLENIH